MRLGRQYFDVRDRKRHGTFCGYCGAQAILKRDGKVFRVGRRYLKRLDCGGCCGVF